VRPLALKVSAEAVRFSASQRRAGKATPSGILRAMSREHVELVRSSLDGWNRGDVDAWLRAAHPDIEWSSEVVRRVEGPEVVYRGTAEMRRFWDEWHTLWDLTIEVLEIRDFGDKVLALARIRARGDASGIDLERPVAYVFEFEDGLARKVRAYLEPQQALEAVGVAE
jgi:ketosteroid isomerase-like protein